MNEQLGTFVAEMHQAGLAHDVAEPDRLRRRRNLEPETARLLSLLVRVAAARRIVEIGTSNGYSTLWLADAAQDVNGQVVSVDLEPSDDARRNLNRADVLQPGLAERVAIRQGDGGAFLAGLDEASVDLLFLDSERVEYPNWWPHPFRVLRAGGVLAIDNVLSHPDEVAPFLALLEAKSPAIVGTTLEVGKGLFVAWRRS